MSFPNDHSMNIIRLDTGEERNTMLNWHLYPADEHNTVPPEPKFIYEDTPGVDGNLDVSENTSDRILFNNRKGEWEFYVANRPLHQPNIDETQTWADIQSDISNFLHGQKCKVIFADDPNYYYIGRLSVTDFEPNKSYQHVTIEYDFEPYKYEHEAFDSGTLSVSGTSSLTAAGSPMPAIPTITITSSKFAFHQHDALTRGEAVYMLYKMSESYGGWGIKITESKFLDVSEDDYYYTAVLFAEEYGITAGISEKIFGGENICTRAQFITMLAAFNWMGNTPSTFHGNIPFTDVKINSYYYVPVKWAWYRKLIAGDGNGHFMPNEPMTRQHACAILYKYNNEPEYTDTTDIIDLAGTEVIAPWYYVAVVKLYNEGIISGYADGTYKPANYITRGQFVTMIYAAAGRPNNGLYTIPFTDVTSDMYCYEAVRYCYNHGFISGTSETTFSPERAMLRKEMIQVLFQYGNYTAINNDNLDYFDPDGDEDNDDAVASGYEVATDVPQESYYFYAVAWGVMHGITTLNAGNMFYPDQKATRAMAAQMLYKLLKILNDWEDDDAATIDQSGSTTTVTNDIAISYETANWRQGYYDSTKNDFISSNAHIRTVFIGMNESETYGTPTSFTINCPSAYKYRVHWFSSVDSSTQTFLSETSWITGTGSNRRFSKPSGATYFMVSATLVGNSGTSGGGGETTEDWTVSSDYWRVGRLLNDTGRPDSSQTDFIYTNLMYEITGNGLVSMRISIDGANGTDSYAIFYYDSNRQFISHTNYSALSPSGAGSWDRIYVSDMPSGAEYVRFCFYADPAPTVASGERLKITATIDGSREDDAVDPSAGENISMLRTYTKTQYLPPVTDITKYVVDYSDAIKYCYDKAIVDDPMIERAPMEVTLENSKGTKTVTVPSGEDLVPELLVVDGENEFTVEGTGTYRIQFRRGSL